MANKVCEKCGRSLKESEFYTYRSGEKLEVCKKCLTMHVDNFDDTTFVWLMEKLDVPYVPEVWGMIRDKALLKTPNLNGMSVFGKYLSTMKLNQWKNARWADTERLQAEAKEKKAAAAAAQAEKDKIYKEKYENGELSEAEYKTLVSSAQQIAAGNGIAAAPTNPYLGPNNPYNENTLLGENELPDPAAQLTNEDKIYLAMKWGRLYQPSEWVELEKMYEEMMNSFDIQDADTKNTLVLLCKTTLKSNQAIDAGDIEGYQKLSKVAEGLRKTAKFTAAQKKDQTVDYVDSIGELVRMCEEEGFIPRYCTNVPKDKVDKTLQDMNNYVYKLVTQDLGFGKQIEDSIKKIQIQKEMNQAAEKAEAAGEDPNDILKNSDYLDYYNNLNEQQEQDNQIEEEEDE